MRAEKNDENTVSRYDSSPGLDDRGWLSDGEGRPPEEGARVEAPPPDVCRLREASSRSQRLPLRPLARPTLLRQKPSDSLRGFTQVPVLLVVGGDSLEDDDRVALR
jgi:hypothetical protein